MGTNSFVCAECGDSFTIKSDILARYPGWIPRTCLRCRDKASGKSGGQTSSAARKDCCQHRPLRCTAFPLHDRTLVPLFDVDKLYCFIS